MEKREKKEEIGDSAGKSPMMKKKDLKNTPQRGEEEEEETKEQEEEPTGTLEKIVRSIGGLRNEIEQGREELKNDIRKEIKSLAHRIENIEERWKNKEELYSKLEKVLIRWKEQEKGERLCREKEKKELIAEILQRVEEKMKEVRKDNPICKGREEEDKIWTEMKQIKRKVTDQEKKERKNNVVIKGLKTKEGKVRQGVEGFLKDEFGIEKETNRVECKGNGEWGVIIVGIRD